VEQFSRWSGAVVGLLSSLVVASIIWGQFSARLDAVERAISDHRTQASHSASGERVARLEAQLVNLNATLEKVERSLDMIRLEMAADRKREMVR
jgi:hypothetical protein